MFVWHRVIICQIYIKIGTTKERSRNFRFWCLKKEHELNWDYTVKDVVKGSKLLNFKGPTFEPDSYCILLHYKSNPKRIRITNQHITSNEATNLGGIHIIYDRYDPHLFIIMNWTLFGISSTLGTKYHYFIYLRHCIDYDRIWRNEIYKWTIDWTLP